MQLTVHTDYALRVPLYDLVSNWAYMVIATPTWNIKSWFALMMHRIADRRAYIGMIRCEAHRKKVPNLLKIIRASGMLVSEVEAIGLDDPVVQETLQQDKVKASLQALAKEQAPK